ncbi:RlpA-like double-psi beta-barrel-protein domain-containing protein-containing protein [Gilbertella persicaria]|uniref:RlpA-like double-psi beta-barrel-protein domain-containing protein-containing protein n=1 Tax=Gilbertella persicaria TaxID=101096 RepID=UPI00221E8483|nr:RlpA-like double-psi beta-barrel-protein domain-containing protein-containing protein [Gilbertella persicaria]KAI8084067.1 RlpA-like double-psi beta-barrel-protein domain-containing protein-containing protein [Gilbertella persicaria]
MSSFSRITLFFATVFIACACIVSAAPITTTTTSTTSTTILLETPTAVPSGTVKSFKKSTSSSSGSYSGDATYYTPGLGSCGGENSDSDMIAALNHVQMSNGANSNNNPNCGRSISIKGPNGSVTVKIVDTCPGCASGDIDMSPAAFAKIADLADGRVPISWSWN